MILAHFDIQSQNGVCFLWFDTMTLIGQFTDDIIDSLIIMMALIGQIHR